MNNVDNKEIGSIKILSFSIFQPTVQQQIQQVEASTPNAVEWTYLEPVQPSSTYTLPSTNNIEEVMVPITTASPG